MTNDFQCKKCKGRTKHLSNGLCRSCIVDEHFRFKNALEEIVRIERDEKSNGTVLGERVHDEDEMIEIAQAALDGKERSE